MDELIGIRRLSFYERIELKDDLDDFVNLIKVVIDESMATASDIFDKPVTIANVDDIMVVPWVGFSGIKYDKGFIEVKPKIDKRYYAVSLRIVDREEDSK